LAANFIIEPQRESPLAREVDVLVAGGGIAGCFAAIAAARSGARALIIERFGALGGNMGPGLIQGGSLIYFASIAGGAPALTREFWRRMEALRGPNAVSNSREAAAASYAITKMLLEAGGEMMLSARACDPLVEGQAVAGLFVETKSGRRAIRARVVIDATGEADIAARAAAPMFHPGDPVSDEVERAIEKLKPEFSNWSSAEDGRFRGTTNMGCGFQIAGIDWARAVAHEQAGNALPLGPGQNLAYEQVEVKGIGLVSLLAVDSRPPKLPKGRFHPPDRSGELLEGRLEVNGPIDAGNAEHISALELRSRMFLFETVERLRASVPGFEQAYLLQVAPYLHSRGGTCIDGEYFVSAVDMLNRSRFDDVVFVATLVDDAGAEIGPRCDVPYRAMLPRGMDGLIAVGRSASHRRLLRTRPNAMLFGIAGGAAAAIATQTHTTPKTLDVKVLQRRLLSEGVHLGDCELGR